VRSVSVSGQGPVTEFYVRDNKPSAAIKFGDLANS